MKTALTAVPHAVLFDAYGTLFDVYGIAALAEQLFPGQGAALAALWRDKQIDYTRIRTLSDPDGRHYRPFWEVTRDALRYAGKRLGLNLSEDDETRLMQAYRTLAPFAEARAVLQALRGRGIPTGILSNGNRSMLHDVVQAAGFDGLFTHVLSVDELRRYKTHPMVYALGCEKFACASGNILFVSSNAWDACAATWYGYVTLWVNRAGLPAEELGVAPTRTGTSLADVMRFFD
jgi:2-haloacid dehalogenase